ncbi:hypothetical protein QR680_000979 [Steinernema hermaphroditum]|uniref:Uncharacterized protein n=1 Tax=Steinernema hermaphroditum TaxID=289476 RepID=A0AA39GYJ0_9BILA|nr:hypothetical protein QR680_000979 [Steinernema hermaphroditum]
MVVTEDSPFAELCGIKIEKLTTFGACVQIALALIGIVFKISTIDYEGLEKMKDENYTLPTPVPGEWSIPITFHISQANWNPEAPRESRNYALCWSAAFVVVALSSVMTILGLYLPTKPKYRTKNTSVFKYDNGNTSNEFWLILGVLVKAFLIGVCIAAIVPMCSDTIFLHMKSWKIPLFEYKGKDYHYHIVVGAMILLVLQVAFLTFDVNCVANMRKTRDLKTRKKRSTTIELSKHDYEASQHVIESYLTASKRGVSPPRWF